MSKYKYTILTCITNGYEPVREPEFIPSDDIELICVTDNKNMTSKYWKIIYEETIHMFDVKHNPYKYASSDTCLWLDGSYQLLTDPYENFIKPFKDSDKEMMISIHDIRHNIYEECIYWLYCRGMITTNVSNYLHFLVNKNYNSDTLFQTSVILTKNTPAINDIFEKERNFEKKLSLDGPYRDDQTTLSYIITKYYYNWDKLVLMNFQYTAQNPYFSWRMHGQHDVLNVPQQLSFTCFDMHQPFLYCIK